VPLLKALIERIDAYAYAEVREGRAPEGYKLVEKRATRKWRDEHTVAMELGKLGLTQDELFAPREVKSPAQLEKIERIKGNKEVLAPFIIKESSGLVLVPNDDKRPAWRADAKDEFKALEAPKATVLDTDIVVAVEVVVDPFS